MQVGIVTSKKIARSSESSCGGELQYAKTDAHNADNKMPVRESDELPLRLLGLTSLALLAPFPGLGPFQYLKTHDPRMVLPICRCDTSFLAGSILPPSVVEKLPSGAVGVALLLLHV